MKFLRRLLSLFAATSQQPEPYATIEEMRTIT